MPERLPQSGAEEEKNLEDIDRLVYMSDGRLANELGELELKNLLPNQLGSGGFNQTFFETDSGNIYVIYEKMDADGNRISNEFAIANAHSNEGKGKEAKGLSLSDEEIENGVLKIGEPFEYGKGGISTRITNITAVTSKMINPATLEGKPEEEKSDIDQRFYDIIKPKDNGK